MMTISLELKCVETHTRQDHHSTDLYIVLLLY